MRKKLLVFISTVVIAALGYSFSYFNQYDIEDNDASIESDLETWLNRPNGIEITPKILEIERLGDTTSHIVLFQLTKGDYEFSHLVKGLNGKFKINMAGYGSGHAGELRNASYQVIDTNKGKYMVLYGENPDLKIDHIIATTLNDKYDFIFDVSEGNIFLQSAIIPKNIEQPFPAELSFYDNADNEIE